MEKNKKIILVVLTVLIVGGLFWFLFSKNYNGFNSTTNTSSDYLKSIQPISTAPTATPAVVASNPKVGDAADNISLYVKMVNKFFGTRFQFSQNCAFATPTDFVIKKGVQFMVDNRDAKAHTFSFAGQKYQVGAYGYAIVSTPKIGKLPVFCDGIQRVMVNVER
ncbi:MAG: hypothetical protein HY979_00375 [Candidatus Magasanikbacteria bacterium]|nr:hypothetical protein [Candidatus Magasanikbacteria bacterium]